MSGTLQGCLKESQGHSRDVWSVWGGLMGDLEGRKKLRDGSIDLRVISEGYLQVSEAFQEDLGGSMGSH